MPNTRNTLVRAAALALPTLLVACEDASRPLGLESGDQVQAVRPALVAGATRTLFKSTFVTAEFPFTTLGCISSEVNVSVADETTHQAGTGAPTGGPFLFASILQFDQCAGEYVSSIIVNAEQGASVSGNLREASLQATATAVDDIGGEEVQVTFDLTWTSSGDLFSNTEKTISKPGGLTFSFRGRFYEATISGTVLLEGMNITPEPGSGIIAKSTILNVSF